jgi:hypothetical protein
MLVPKCCIICSAVASPDLQLQYCARCQSALYCSKACQRIDWKQKQHKQICKLLNVGHGDRQVRTNYHTSFSLQLKEQFERDKQLLSDGVKRFFRLFEESTFEGSLATAQSMTKFAKRQTELEKKAMLHYSLHFLVRFTSSEMLSWPNSPLLVMLKFVDPNELLEGQETCATPLHLLTDLADPLDYSTHVNQLILVRQLVEHGANVNAQSIPQGLTPLHRACFWGNVTNLDYVEFLLEAGANPNAQDYKGLTPLTYSKPHAPGAAKFLLNWPTTDANITCQSGESFQSSVRRTLEYFSDKLALPDNPEMLQHQLAIQQWRTIEEMLVFMEKGAAETSITTLE